jgi:hypothetical protein
LPWRTSTAVAFCATAMAFSGGIGSGPARSSREADRRSVRRPGRRPR